MNTPQRQQRAERLQYNLNHDTNYYDLTEAAPGFTKMPPELKYELTQETERIRAGYILRGRVRGGRYTFFTGLRPTGVDGIQYGDHYETRKGKGYKSLLLTYLKPNNQQLTVLFFPGYYVYPPRIAEMAKHYEAELKQNGPLFEGHSVQVHRGYSEQCKGNGTG